MTPAESRVHSPLILAFTLASSTACEHISMPITCLAFCQYKSSYYFKERIHAWCKNCWYWKREEEKKNIYIYISHVLHVHVYEHAIHVYLLFIK